jgi:hypothetical protein
MAKPDGSKNLVPALVIVAAIVGGGLFALARKPSSTPSPQPDVTTTGAPASASAPPGTGTAMQLPPGHPPLGGAGAGSVHAPMAPPEEAAKPVITWTAPAKWTKVPNASAFRMATYDVPKQAGDSEDPQLTVSRIGGDVESNAARWIAQFDAAGQKTAKRSEITVAGFKTTIVEVHGAYAGMSGAAENGWVLLGAIVETPGMSHFFKMTGPEKSVAAARADFDALVASIKPS